MAKFVFCGVPAHGHVNPTLPVVKSLVQQGHQVVYYNTEEFQEKIDRTGAAFRPYPAPNITARELAGLVANLANVTVRLLGESRRLLPFMLAELEREQPDLVVFDSICLWGMQAAHLLGLPTAASISTFVQEGTERMLAWRDVLFLIRKGLPAVPRLLRLRRSLVKAYGPEVFPASSIFPCTGARNIVYTSREFQPETDFVDDTFHFVGPMIDATTREPVDFPWQQLDGRPLIYISLGTIHASAAFLQDAFTAFAAHPAQFVVAAGRETDTSLLDPPANFLVRPFVPQLELLPRVDLFVSHGGMNSINESLYEGVPLVIVPQHVEQLLNGRQVVAHGAGILIGDRPPYGRVTPSQLQEAVATVLADGQYRENAARIGRSFRAAGGRERAVALLTTALPG